MRGLQYHDFRGRVHVPERHIRRAARGFERFNQSQPRGYPGDEDMG